MDTTAFDLIVLGGGNAITVATECAAGGMNVALIESGPLGGTCPNRGCIPTKLLLAHADVATQVREAARFHVHAAIERIDGAAVLADVRAYIDGFDERIGGSLPENLTLVRAHGRFHDNRTIEADGRLLTAPRIVVATGTRPAVPPIPGLADTPYWTNRNALRIDNLPRSLAVVGGGFVACELGYFFQAMGVETTLLVREGELLSPEDETIRARFTRAFSRMVPTRFHTQTRAIAYEDGRFVLSLGSSEGEGRLEAEALLMATGRRPNTDDIGVANTDLRVDERGFIRSDDCLRTNVDGIWSLGDIAGRFMFTHAANFEAEQLAKRLLAVNESARCEPLDYGPMPHAVFTRPEIAGVGPTEQELRAKNIAYVVGTQEYMGATKGRALKDEDGICKLLVSPDGKILGCHILGEQASILLHEVLAVIRTSGRLEGLLRVLHIHPSLAEVVRGAARNAKKQLDAV